MSDPSPSQPGDREPRTREPALDGIGQRLSAVRSDRGLKVSEIARLIGVTPSLISQIERGQSRPSVGTLFSLARTLEVPIDAFFAEDSHATASAVDIDRVELEQPALRDPRSPEQEGDGWGLSGESGHRYLVRRGTRATVDIKGGVRWERLTPTSLDWLDFLELIYAPRAESDSQLYRHPGIELVLLVEGRLDIFLGFDRHELEPGDSMAFPSSTPHRYVNPTDEMARAITVILRDDLSSLGRRDI